MKPRPSIFIPELESFIDSNYVRRPNSVFLEMEAQAKQENIPILSPASGAVLSQLIQFVKPKEVFEFGTGIGYSTLWMYYGNPSAKIATIDRNISQSKNLLNYAEKMDISQKLEVELIFGLVEEFIQTDSFDPASFDFYFVDCDKIKYPEIFDFVYSRAKSGTHFVFDNVLWHGRVLSPDPHKPSDLAIQSLWEKVKSLDIPFVLNPVGDGLLYFQKV